MNQSRYNYCVLIGERTVESGSRNRGQVDANNRSSLIIILPLPFLSLALSRSLAYVGFTHSAHSDDAIAAVIVWCMLQKRGTRALSRDSSRQPGLHTLFVAFGHSRRLRCIKRRFLPQCSNAACSSRVASLEESGKKREGGRKKKRTIEEVVEF